MIALDTNVLVRYLTQDDPAQAAAADEVVAGLTADAPGFICREVIVELVWVLERRYRVPRPAIASALEALLAAAEIAVEAAGDVGTALFRYRDQGLGFADQMIAAAGRRAGASKVVTFDRRAARIEGVELESASQRSPRLPPG
jgi:predicted nucleic-acid-binding protein